jgi:hypothetical protein
LTRHGSTDGVAALTAALADAAEGQADRPPETPTGATGNAAFDRLLVVTNSLKAVDQLAARLSSSERARLLPVLEKLASDYPNRGVRAEAARTASTLKSTAP